MDADRHTKLTQIFRTLFNQPDLEPTDELTAHDVPGWDSFNHINLIVQLEQAFSIRFSNSEVGGLKNVGELKRLIEQKLSQ